MLEKIIIPTKTITKFKEVYKQFNKLKKDFNNNFKI